MAQAFEIKELHRILQPLLDKKVQIFSYHTTNLIPPGENYGGIILKLDVKIKGDDNSEKLLKLVAKLGPPNEMLCKMFNIQFTFKREMIMYVDIIPTLRKFQEGHCIREDKLLNLFPKCYGARMNLRYADDIMDENAIIVFENLQTSGYVMGNRMVGFDLETTKSFVKNLSRFHAIPIAMKILNPKLFNEKISVLNAASFGDSFTDEMKETFLRELNNMIETIDDCKQYAAKIVDLVDKGFKFEERFLQPEGQYCTIVHHDLWVNNILILKQNIEFSQRIKIIDLQMACYGSLAHDLLFFLYSSVQHDVFDEYYDDLIKTYYDSFISCLLEFNINIDLFSWESFLNELNIIGPHQISHIVIMLRPIFMEKDKVQDMADMKVDEMSELRALNKNYINKLRSIILDFAKRNWL